MGKTVFIPLTDDLLYEHPERIFGPVIPFSQHARRLPVQSAEFTSAMHSPDTKMRLKPGSVTTMNRSKPKKTALPQVGTLR